MLVFFLLPESSQLQQAMCDRQSRAMPSQLADPAKAIMAHIREGYRRRRTQKVN